MPEGNWLRKKRMNFSISASCEAMMRELSEHWGVSGSDLIELGMRHMYEDLKGKGARPDIPAIIRAVRRG